MSEELTEADIKRFWAEVEYAQKLQAPIRITYNEVALLLNAKRNLEWRIKHLEEECERHKARAETHEQEIQDDLLDRVAHMVERGQQTVTAIAIRSLKKGGRPDDY